MTLSNSTVQQCGSSIYVYGALKDETFKQLQLSIASKPASKRPKRIYVSSNGGSVIPTLAFADTLETLNEPIDICALDYCHSAAVFLLQAATGRRLAYPSTEFMTHSIAWEIPITAHNCDDVVAALQETWQLCLNLMARRTGRSASFWHDFMSRERYFHAQRALKLGLIDEIARARPRARSPGKATK